MHHPVRILWYMLFIKAGDEGENQYGENPLKAV